MNVNAKSLSVAATFSVVSSAIACQSDTSFNCPSAYSFVIKSSFRKMDEVALRIACSRLAHELYVNEYLDPGSDYFGLIPPKEAVEPLRKKQPILLNCPEHSLYETQLPIRVPSAYVPPEDAVRHGITGWVDLELDVDDDGKVQNARIVDSSNSILESGVIDYVLKFQYPKKSHYSGQYMKRNGFQVRIVTDYFQIARAKGCEWDDPRAE